MVELTEEDMAMFMSSGSYRPHKGVVLPNRLIHRAALAYAASVSEEGYAAPPFRTVPQTVGPFFPPSTLAQLSCQPTILTVKVVPEGKYQNTV